MKPDIVKRYGHNPILTKAEIPYPVETVHNAAVVKHADEYIMLFRSHLRTGRSIIGLARSPGFSGSHRIPAAVTCTKPLQRVHALSRLSEHAKLLAAPQLLSVALFCGYRIVYPTAILRHGAKDVGLRLRVERILRDEFLRACRAKDQPAAQVLREFMRTYVAGHAVADRPASTGKQSRKITRALNGE
jgi:hypothetical protein